MRQLQVKKCYPFYLLARPVQNMTYTITDSPSFFDIEQWTAYPSHCPVSYKFELIDENPDI